MASSYPRPFQNWTKPPTKKGATGRGGRISPSPAPGASLIVCFSKSSARPSSLSSLPPLVEAATSEGDLSSIGRLFLDMWGCRAGCSGGEGLLTRDSAA
eukprot:scaffold131102_cov48-Phaeocystis_antarctica.AAC.1